MKNLKKRWIVLTLALFVFATACASSVGMEQGAGSSPNQGEQPAASGSDVSEGADADMTAEVSYPIVDSGQVYCYDDSGASTTCPDDGSAFFGQDAQYNGNQPSYTDNGDGTITDHVTGLMWQQDPGEKMTYDEAAAGADDFSLASYDDWRLPSIKELYSLILFSGYDPSGESGSDTSGLTPFIDDAFDFEYGDTASGERIIDSQFATSTQYVSKTMNNNATMFGVNFADGRIKGYPTSPMPGQIEGKLFYVLYVRGNSAFGLNDFVDNGNGTITDNATGLTWMQDDSGTGMDWGEALNYCENLEYSGTDEWRLPNAKELQSIVDYSRSPDTTDSAAIDALFNATPIVNETGQSDFPFYWSSTTHASQQSGMNAAYVAFGRAMGYMNDTWMDVHGAGSQRSDPKSGDAADYSTGRGPQGDAIRINNYARCVSGGTDETTRSGGETDQKVGSGQMPSGDAAQNLSGQPGSEALPGQGAQPGINRTPPQEAIEACAALSQGDGCSITTPNGIITGICANLQEQMVCVPEGGPTDGGQPQPPTSSEP